MTTTEQTYKIPPAGTKPRFGDLLNSRHLYEIEVGGGWTIEVDADSRTQAGVIARREGYVVRSMNMTG